MSPTAYIVRETLISGVMSAVLSVAVGWLKLHTEVPIGLWGIGGMGFDLLFSSFATGLFMTGILTTVLRMHVKHGRSPKEQEFILQVLAVWLARISLFYRSCLLGFAAMLIIAPVGLATLVALNIDILGLHEMLLCKAVQGFAIGLAFTPLIVIAVMAEQSTGYDRM